MILNMDKSLIKAAANALKIQTVNLLDARIQSDELLPASFKDGNSEIKIGRGLVRFSSFELENDNNEFVKAVSFVYQCGLKISRNSEEQLEDEEHLSIERSEERRVGKESRRGLT